MKPRVISLFSGVGTFDHGFHQAGWQTVHLCEWDPKAREVLAARFPGVPITNDVREINGAELPDAECVMFGSPCQDLSVAGKRGGLEGERSGLFMEAIRIIREKREATNGEFPRFALWENVPGAYSSNSGRDFAAVLSELAGSEVGVPGSGWSDSGLAFGSAAQVAWRLLDSQYFGVPQRRRRIFALADFGGERAGEILFESEGVRWHPQPRRAPREEAAGDARQGATGDSGEVSVASTLTSWYGQGSPRGDGADNLVPEIARCQATRNQRNDAETENLLPVPIQDGREVEKRQNGLGVGKPGEPAYTLDTLGAQAVAFQQNTRDEVRLFGGDGQSVGALMAEPGMKQQNYIAFDYKASVQRDPMCGQVSPTLEAQDKTAIVYPVLDGIDTFNSEGLQGIISHGPQEKTDTGTLLPTLRKEVGAEETPEWRPGVSDSLQSSEVLRQSMHGEGFRCASSERGCELDDGSLPCPQDFAERSMCSLWGIEERGRSPQGRQLEEQRSRESGTPVSKLPQSRTPKKQADMLGMRRIDQGSGSMQQALPQVQAMGRPQSDESQPTHPRYGVRRLTPTETERLQGMPDGWTDVDGMADSHRYRFMGNGGAAPVLRWIARRMGAVL